jgi:hypothetical protein
MLEVSDDFEEMVLHFEELKSLLITPAEGRDIIIIEMSFVEVFYGFEVSLCESAPQDKYPHKRSFSCQHTVNHGPSTHPFFVLLSLYDDDFGLFPCFSRRTDLFFERSTRSFLKSVGNKEVFRFFEPDGGSDVDLVDVPIGPFAAEISAQEIFLFGRQNLGIGTSQNSLIVSLPLPHLTIIKHQRSAFVLLELIFAIFLRQNRRLDVDFRRGCVFGEFGLHFAIFCL